MDNTLDRKVFLWTLIGPFCLAAFMGLLFIKGGKAHEPFIWAALISLPLSYQGRQTGIALIFGLLSLGIVYFVWQGNDFSLWEYGLVFSLVLSFVVTALSFEELRVAAEEVNEKIREYSHVEEKYLEQLAFVEEKGQSDVKKALEKLSAKEAAFSLFQTQRKEEEKIKVQLQHQLSLLEKESHGNRQELEKIKDELVKKEEELLLEKKKGEEHLMRQAVLAEMSDHIETLSREKGLLEKTLVRLQTELEDLQLDVSKKEEKSAASIPEVLDEQLLLEKTIAEAKLKQLKEQFKEKSSILDGTRKELFHAKEKISVLQKELDELKIYERSEVEAAFEKSLKELDWELKSQEDRYLNEVEALQTIVSRLIGNH